MNERGFFTVIGLCLLLVVAISIRGVNEFETNYSRGITNIQAEHKLQNLAESYLIDAAESFNPEISGSKVKIFSDNLGNIEKLKNVTVEVWGEHSNIQIKNSSYTNFDNLPQNATGKIFLSVASCDSFFVEGKIYQSSIAYILDADENKTLHFMNRF